MPPERTSRRQEPASCESCRKKKLRCDRQCPCHNCETRSVQCVFQGARQQSDSARHESSSNDLAAENAAIRARLLRLEEAVLRNEHAAPLATASLTSGPPTARTVGLRSPLTSTDDPPEMEQAKGFSEDSRRLEDVHSRGAAPLPRVTHSLAPRLVPLSDLAATVNCPNPPAQLLLPERHATMHLFAYYVEHVDSLQHVIHVSTTRGSFEAIYDNLETNQAISSGLLALLLAVIAHTSCFWALGSSEGSHFSSRQEASAVSTYWLRCALDAIEHVWRVEGAGLEVIQAKILLMFLIYHTEGLSSKARHLMATALSDAKDLGLHMTDAPQSKVKEITQAEIVQVEMGRRVWWHLVSTGWSAALWGGPQGGVYSVNPSHMQVRKPRNVNDEDLVTKPADFSRPLSEPTSTTYYLERITLGEVCREVADTLLEIQALEDPQQIPYSRIRALDGKFAGILNGPLASGMYTAEDDGSPRYNATLPHIRQQYFTYLTTEARRCKLHLPYLLRLQQDPQYIYSRNTCLQSARNILRLKHILPSEVSDDTTQSVKMIGLMHHFCCAIVILAMDLCVNRFFGSDYERKSEIRAAIKILEDARDSSESAGMFLETLAAIFRIHSVHLHSDQPTKSITSTGYPVEHHLNQTRADYRGRFGVGLFPADFAQTGESGSQDLTDPDVDTMWQGFLDLGNEPQAWDALFSDIEMGIPGG